jgi:hypothetical protein
MGYREALECAGAEVHAYEEFGDYQGVWLAYVTFDGVTGFIRDYFGSCSGCDAFEDEMGYINPTKEQLGKFGERYLEDILTKEEVLALVSKHADWDVEAKTMTDWVNEVCNADI